MFHNLFKRAQEFSSKKRQTEMKSDKNPTFMKAFSMSRKNADKMLEKCTIYW